MREGCADSLSIGLELGFSFARIKAETAWIPDQAAKLRTIIELKILDIGKADTAQKLLEVCKILPTPIHGRVMDVLEGIA